MPSGRDPSAVASPKTTGNAQSLPTTSLTGTSRQIRQTGGGWPASHTSGPQKAGSTFPLAVVSRTSGVPMLDAGPLLARAVGWSMKADRDASLVMDALMMAVWRRGKADAPFITLTRGSQYTSEQFQRRPADNGITCSMGRAANVWDNSAIESFFSTLKPERTAARSTASETKPAAMCSTTSNASRRGRCPS